MCYYYYMLPFMQAIFNYIPEINHVSKVFVVTAVLCL